MSLCKKCTDHFYLHTKHGIPWVHCHHEEEKLEEEKALKENGKVKQNREWISNHIHNHISGYHEEVKNIGCFECSDGSVLFLTIEDEKLETSKYAKYCPECGRKLTT